MQQAEFTKSAGPSNGPGQKACLQCRRVKMKCRLEPAAVVCERCLRKSMNCVFEQHRRGRKPGTRLTRKAQPPSSPTADQVQSRPDRPRRYADIPKASCDEPAIDTVLEDEHLSRDQIRRLDMADHTSPAQSIWEQTNAPLQSEVLDMKAGAFSLQTVLSTTRNVDLQEIRNEGVNGPSPETTSDFGLDDPISCKILNFPIALGLFDSFMRSLNPFVSQFDPNLHTFEYVRQKSSFLLTSILAAASRAFHPPLHPMLRAHTEALLAKAFINGEKSTEIVQAVLVSTYWKDSDDARSFLLIGYAIRICIEMGWHKLKSIAAQSNGTQQEIREARNIRRTWLVIFVYDRSISMQMDKPYMIEQNNLITTSHGWYEEPFAVFGADALLCAFVSLRIISSEILELVSPYRDRHIPLSDILMKMLNSNITRWEEHWLHISEDDRVNRCQAFLIRFYGSHLRLLLNSFSLQDSLKSSCSKKPISKEALWTCYSSAIGMLKQISDEFGPLKLLYFAQDSVHIMTAYAAVFLIKMLLSLPSSLSKEFEASSIEAIRKTARTFEDQCATQRTSCALQARFLSNVAIQYENLQLRSRSVAAVPPSQELVLNANVSVQTDDGNMQSAEGSLNADSTSIEYEQPAAGNWTLDDNEQWERMFATAGYSIQDGVFMPDFAIDRI